MRYQSIFNFEKVKELELYTTSRDGVIWIDVLITSLRYPPYGYLLQIQNITNQKLAEMKWVESEARWQFALDGANDGVWELGRINKSGLFFVPLENHARFF